MYGTVMFRSICWPGSSRIWRRYLWWPGRIQKRWVLGFRILTREWMVLCSSSLWYQCYRYEKLPPLIATHDGVSWYPEDWMRLADDTRRVCVSARTVHGLRFLPLPPGRHAGSAPFFRMRMFEDDDDEGNWIEFEGGRSCEGSKLESLLYWKFFINRAHFLSFS